VRTTTGPTRFERPDVGKLAERPLLAFHASSPRCPRYGDQGVDGGLLLNYLCQVSRPPYDTQEPVLQ
jgi:hypothetical protein